MKLVIIIWCVCLLLNDSAFGIPANLNLVIVADSSSGAYKALGMAAEHSENPVTIRIVMTNLSSGPVVIFSQENILGRMCLSLDVVSIDGSQRVEILAVLKENTTGGSAPKTFQLNPLDSIVFDVTLQKNGWEAPGLADFLKKNNAAMITATYQLPANRRLLSGLGMMPLNVKSRTEKFMIVGEEP
jgi:hypothetical protein